MRQVTCHKRAPAGASILVLLAVALAPVGAAEDLSGEWELASEFNGRSMLSTLALTQDADGTLTGQWGATALSNVKLDGQKLTFVRTIKFGDQEFATKFAGTLQDGKLTGTASSDRGQFTVAGTRRPPECPALGQWEVTYRYGDQDRTAKLLVTQKADGALDAQWTRVRVPTGSRSPVGALPNREESRLGAPTQRGESAISNVRCVDGKLSFTRTVKFNDNEFQTTFTGAVADGKLTGVNKSEQRETPVSGWRFGGDLIGKWELTGASDRGPWTSLLTVRGDLTGRYESFFGALPLKDLKLDGNQVAFQVTFGFGDQPQDVEYRGTLEGKTLKLQVATPDGTREFTGRKIEPLPPIESLLKPMARQPDVIFVPTPQAVVDKMLELAEVKPGDVVYDLGCGNGRIVVTAAKKYGVKAFGFDINPERIKESLENVRANHVENLVTIRQEDIFTLDLSQASVITLYLLPSLNVKLMPQLAKCKPGTRIVSHDFDMRGAKPVVVHQMNVEDDDSDENTNYGPEHTIYKWVVPWEKE